MSAQEPVVLLRRALRQLAEDARYEAALFPVGTSTHDFYWGVRTAAEDRLNAHRADVHDEAWMERQAPAFREGYLKARNLMASTAGRAPTRFHLPVP